MTENYRKELKMKKNGELKKSVKTVLESMTYVHW